MLNYFHYKIYVVKVKTKEGNNQLKEEVHVIPLLLDPNEFWEHKHNSDVLIPLHIVHHCDLHSQSPVPALEFLSCP